MAQRWAGLSCSQDSSSPSHKRVHCWVNLSCKDSIASGILSSTRRYLSDYCLLWFLLLKGGPERTLWSFSFKLHVQGQSVQKKFDWASRVGQVLESEGQWSRSTWLLTWNKTLEPVLLAGTCFPNVTLCSGKAEGELKLFLLKKFNWTVS